MLVGIIPAAGSSTRMKTALNGAASKVLIRDRVENRCIIEDSIDNLIKSGVKDFIIAVNNDSQEIIKNIANSFSSKCNIEIVKGGESRFHSVFNCLQYCRSNFKLQNVSVVIHDAARPNCNPALIINALSIASSDEGVILAIPATNTIKRSIDGITVTETLNRSELFEIQTPQIFPLEFIFEAYNLAHTSSLDLQNYFDDAMVYEKSGKVVKIATGSKYNLKITGPDDIEYYNFLKSHKLQ